MAPFVGGSFGSKVFSPTLVVYANEIIEQSRQFSKGFTIDDQLIAFDEIKKIGAGGNFISSRQTMKQFREAYHTSSIFPRLSLEKWQEINHPEAYKLLQEKTIDLINNAIFPDDQAEIIKQGEYLISQRRSLLK
jgi:trimethylamine--corrinoid protein Co-methyltransferase